MATLTIDGKQIEVDNNATIYDAAKNAGIRIPILCHDKKLHPFGGCRMCLVEVEQMKGRLIPACTTPVSEGMIVTTTNDEIVKARKLVLELLLLKHPLDCPVCDAAGDCDLQNLTYEYGVNKNNFVDEKFHEEIDYNNPLIERDMNRCVHCGKCARICDEIVSFGALSFVNRGIEAQIGTPYDQPLNCEFCGSCISVCPVGALNSRPFKFKARWWALKKEETVCSYCGTGCQLTYGVKDDKVLTTVYNEDQGFHNGQLCCRGRFGYQYINSPDRLTTPLVRKNGVLYPATWEEAYGIIVDKFAAAKGATGCLVTPRLTNEELYALKSLAFDTFGTPHLDHSAGYAHTPLTRGLVQSFGSTTSPSRIADIQKSSLILLVNSDAYETHPVIGFEINLAVKRKEADLRVVSDKKGKITRLPKAKSYIHRPGTAEALLTALAAVVVQEKLTSEKAASLSGYAELVARLEKVEVSALAGAAGVDADAVTALARDYAAAERALIILPTGLAYPAHNASLVSACANLAILTGKIGVEGGGLLVLAEKNNSQGAADLCITPGPGGKDARSILAAAASGEIKVLYIVGENPVVSYPDRKGVERGIEKAEFVVVQDLFLTETAAMADVVLPARSAAEKSGTFTSTGAHVQRIHPSIRPVGESKSDLEIFTDIARRLGGSIPGVEEIFNRITKEIPGYAGIDYATLGTVGAYTAPPCSPTLVPLDPPATIPAPEGKVALVTGNALHHCGTMSLHGVGTTAVSPAGYLEVSRDDAARLSLSEGEMVTVASETGSVTLPVRISSRMPKGTAFAPYHFAENSVNTITCGDAVTWVTISR
ncbi:MAG: molybdopterin-dependent oxidoreductase [Desulfuromonadia bacterium]